MESGRYTFWSLLNATETLRIPKVQRDYAQGREDSGKSSLYNEVRTSFLESFTLLVLRRKDYESYVDDDNVYDIRCINRNYNLYSSPHYQPFYKALANTLEEKGSTIRVSSGIEYTGSQIEYKHPCTLTDGRIVRIKHNGCWTIDDNDVALPKGVDVIEAMAEFIMNNC